MFGNIELGHLPKLEREMIRYALDNGDVTESVEMAILNCEDTDEALAAIADGFSEMFTEELSDDIESYVEEEDTETASDFVHGIGAALADCFEIKTTRCVEATGDEPDFERCAVRVLAHYAIERYPNGLAGLYDEMEAL